MSFLGTPQLPSKSYLVEIIFWLQSGSVLFYERTMTFLSLADQES